MSSAIPDFWEQLNLFWNEDRINKWKNTIFPDSQNPEIGVERCFNLISLASHAHDMWNMGLFALKPLELSRNRKELTVQFFWQVPGNHGVKSQIDLLTEPTSSEGLEIVVNESGKHWLTRFENDGSTPAYSIWRDVHFHYHGPKKPTAAKPGTLRDAMDSLTSGGNVWCCGMAELGLG